MTSQQHHDVDDAAVAEELRAHHAIMIADLDRLTAGFLDAAVADGDTAPARPRPVMSGPSPSRRPGRRRPGRAHRHPAELVASRRDGPERRHRVHRRRCGGVAAASVSHEDLRFVKTAIST
jgi:hypothetical protein